MSVALSGSPFPGVSARELAEQLAGAQTLSKKAPEWAQKPGVYYPPKVHLEQASSGVTARYKTRLAQGKILVDLTGGMGLDSYYFSRVFDTVHYCEAAPHLAEITAHNFQVLGAKNIKVQQGDGMEILQVLLRENTSPDWIYLDPSRRDASGGRVIRLEAYQPNILEWQDSLLETGARILMKTAPLLDLTQGLRAIKNVRQVHVVGVRNEARELLWILEPGFEGEPEIISTDLERDHWPDFRFTPAAEQKAQARFTPPSAYLYEPHAALMKAGPFKLISERFGLAKLHPSSHLYTGPEAIAFPGRRFRILNIGPYKAKNPPARKAHVVSRNFPMSVAQIRKRSRIAPGGDTYLFFTTLAGQGPVVITTQPC
ncbi:class I SAM-dependent methyltransferase [Robiginitalea sp. M366]|uniref:class I SAM-dependent methyltransferase n=1 Tax=Robiginitalea aestuariiviva TaxID=3036903 RepID=UPI00240E35B2|nr:class I SAM-dependent methyltransferase [Robiginitalea aestuariiviva]MDG1572691.1 class I SAM-dependent methyltransferase [Robiginitalea aestuariiviva]